MIGNQVRRAFEPERRDLVQNQALIWNSCGQNHIEGRNPVGCDHQKQTVSQIEGVPDLSSVEPVRQLCIDNNRTSILFAFVTVLRQAQDERAPGTPPFVVSLSNHLVPATTLRLAQGERDFVPSSACRCRLAGLSLLFGHRQEAQATKRIVNITSIVAVVEQPGQVILREVRLRCGV